MIDIVPPQQPQSSGTDPPKSDSNQSAVRWLYSSGVPHTYVDVELKGRRIAAMFDTGCKVSLCLYKYCRNAKIVPTDVKLYAANDLKLK